MCCTPHSYVWPAHLAAKFHSHSRAAGKDNMCCSCLSCARLKQTRVFERHLQQCWQDEERYISRYKSICSRAARQCTTVCLTLKTHSYTRASHTPQCCGIVRCADHYTLQTNYTQNLALIQDLEGQLRETDEKMTAANRNSRGGVGGAGGVGGRGGGDPPQMEGAEVLSPGHVLHAYGALGSAMMVDLNTEGKVSFFRKSARFHVDYVKLLWS